MTSFSPQQINELRETFSLFDVDGNGVITERELKTVMLATQKGISAEEAEEGAREMMEGKKEITFDDFLLLMDKRRRNKSSAQNIKVAFNSLDAEKTGFLSNESLFRYMSDLHEDLTDEELRDMIREADLDEDGRLNYSEFINLVMG